MKNTKTIAAVLAFCATAIAGSLAYGMAAEPLEIPPVRELVKGARFSGVSAGVGEGTKLLGGWVEHDLVFLNIHYGGVFSDEWMPDRWFGGHLHLVGEGGIGYQDDPRAATAVSLTPLVRYVLSREGGSWHPFLQAGLGLAWTDIGLPDLGGKFQFAPQGGGGVLWFFRPNLLASAEYRLVHYSNAGFRRPNSGVNLNTVLFGLSWIH